MQSRNDLSVWEFTLKENTNIPVTIVMIKYKWALLLAVITRYLTLISTIIFKYDTEEVSKSPMAKMCVR